MQFVSVHPRPPTLHGMSLRRQSVQTRRGSVQTLPRPTNRLRRSSSCALPFADIPEEDGDDGGGEEKPGKKLWDMKKKSSKRLQRKLSMGVDEINEHGSPPVPSSGFETEEKDQRKIFTLARSRWKKASRLHTGAFLFGRNVADFVKKKPTRGKVVLVSGDVSARVDLATRLEDYDVLCDQEHDVEKAVAHVRKPFLDHVGILVLYDPSAESDKTQPLLEEMETHGVTFPVTIVVQDVTDGEDVRIRAMQSNFKNARLVAHVPGYDMCCDAPVINPFGGRLCQECKEAYVDSTLSFADFVERILALGEREKKMRDFFSESNKWDTEFTKKYLKRKEYNRTMTGKLAIKHLAMDGKSHMKEHFRAWKQYALQKEVRTKRKTLNLTMGKTSTGNKKTEPSATETEAARQAIARRKLQMEKAREIRIREYSKDDPLLHEFVIPAWVPREAKERHLGQEKSARELIRAASFFSRKIAMQDTVSPWPLMCRALSYARSGKFASALQDIRAVLHQLNRTVASGYFQDHPDYASVIYNRAIIRVKMGRLAEAIHDLSEVIGNAHTNRREPEMLRFAIQNRVVLKRRHGEYVEANRDFYLLRYVADRQKQAKLDRRSRSNSAHSALSADDGISLEKLSLETLQKSLDKSVKEGIHQRHVGHSHSLALLEKARDQNNEDLYKKFKEDEKEKLSTGTIEATEDDVVDDTTILESLQVEAESPKKKSTTEIPVDFKAIVHRSLPPDTDKALRVIPKYRTNEQVKSCKYVTTTMPCFSHYPQPVKDAMSRVMYLRDLRRDQVVCRQGEDPDNYYILIAGKLGVRIRDPRDPEATIVVNHMYPGTSFGELGLVFRQKRSATVYAEELCQVLEIEGSDFRAIGIANYHLKELQEKYQAYIKTGLFDDWTDENLTKLAAITQKKVYQEGDTIINQSQISESFFLLTRGLVKLKAYPNEAEEFRKRELVLVENIARMKEKLRVHRDYDPTGTISKFNKTMHNNLAELEHLRNQRKEFLEKYGDDPRQGEAMETKILTKPLFFGENCILHPDKREASSAVAMCYVEVLAVTKSQIKPEWITKTFRTKLQQREHTVPPGNELRKALLAHNEWNAMKDEYSKMIAYNSKEGGKQGRRDHRRGDDEVDDLRDRKEWY